MISLESDVSGASLSDSATIKNKRHHYNCIKMSRADAFKITEWGAYMCLLYYISDLCVCVFFFF